MGLAQLTAKPMLKLYIGNKNYSSWSMRAWVLMRQAGIEFEETTLRFDSFEPDSRFKQQVLQLNPSGNVPILEDGTLRIWDSLAIAEYLAERHAELALWPRAQADRALARSVCAEMHCGFGTLRQLLPMNIEASLPQVGARLLREQPALAADVARLQALWSSLLARHSGPLLFDSFSIADAYFAPMVMRLLSYAIPVQPAVARYIEQLEQLPAVQQWCALARAEHDFRPFEEPYRTQAGSSS
jgi:glutathione S-transferase